MIEQRKKGSEDYTYYICDNCGIEIGEEEELTIDNYGNFALLTLTNYDATYNFCDIDCLVRYLIQNYNKAIQDELKAKEKLKEGMPSYEQK